MLKLEVYLDPWRYSPSSPYSIYRWVLLAEKLKHTMKTHPFVAMSPDLVVRPEVFDKQTGIDFIYQPASQFLLSDNTKFWLFTNEADCDLFVSKYKGAEKC